MKKSLLIALCIALAAALSIGGTMAYLQDSDSDVNVMTLGNVDIEQLEYERKDPETTSDTQDFVSGADAADSHPLYPAVHDDDFNYSADTGINWDSIGFEDASSKIWNPAKINNEVDKFVFVKNTGKSPAYIRTWFAFEMGDLTMDEWRQMVHLNVNNEHWTWPTSYTETTIDGQRYAVCVVYYKKDNGILPAGEYSYPSLLQVALDKSAGNETIESLGESYEIKVTSQAIQTAGFNSAVAALNEGFGKNDPFDGQPIYPTVEVTAADLTSIDFSQDNATYVLSGDFTEPLTISIDDGLNQVYDASSANFTGESTVTIKAPGVAHAYNSLNAERAGTVTITGFKVETLNVLAYNNEAVNITNNELNSLSVIGGNFELNISGNTVDGNFAQYTDGEDQTNEYGISLRITDYELSMTSNTITNTYSHAIGINGRQGEASSDWGDCGANNKITEFSGNSITVNSTQKSDRAALKIWCDQVYAPYATSGQNPTDAAKALIAKILADKTNMFTLNEGHTIFNIFDYKTSTVIE